MRGRLYVLNKMRPQSLRQLLAPDAGGNNVVQVEKTLRKDALEMYLDGGFNEAAIIYQVSAQARRPRGVWSTLRPWGALQVENGKNAMPAWSDRLSEDEIKVGAGALAGTPSKPAHNGGVCGFKRATKD